MIQSFKRHATVLPEVLDVFVVAGNDDLIVHVAVPGIDELHAFLMDKFSQRRGIVGFRSSA